MRCEAKDDGIPCPGDATELATIDGWATKVCEKHYNTILANTPKPMYFPGKYSSRTFSINTWDAAKEEATASGELP